MRVVFDTNIWLSALFWEGEAAQLIELAEDKKFRLDIIITKEILFEINKVINKEAKFQRFLDNRNENLKALFAKILNLTTLVESSKTLNIVKADPSDNKILEAAVASGADFILSRDKHLTDLKEFEGIKIINTTEFLRIWHDTSWSQKLRKS